jgi:hypothetical protein
MGGKRIFCAGVSALWNVERGGMLPTLLYRISWGGLTSLRFLGITQITTFLYGDVIRFHGGNRVRDVFDLLGNYFSLHVSSF